ncbi:hypothetical protein GCM10011324_31440 [Allosediminivita pacifica]|nr:hypothetical protein GCM10011324_31440 [Allosediminivita pacifica]
MGNLVERIEPQQPVRERGCFGAIGDALQFARERPGGKIADASAFGLYRVVQIRRVGLHPLKKFPPVKA